MSENACSSEDFHSRGLSCGLLAVRDPTFALLKEIRHNCVVKYLGELETREGEHRPSGVPGVVGPGQTALDGKTRHEVMRLLLEQGPMTAVAIAEQLGISPTGVRRHLDTLVSDGEIELRTASRRGPRGRGRPAKLFVLTESGRARFGHAYDDLAVSAIRFLSEHAGPDAIKAFAERRVATLIKPHASVIDKAGDPSQRAEALAVALTKEGYAASTRRVGASGASAGVQLCQHHCPVAHVAAEFPQLCEAETEAFAKLLGTHVQRLATIARGDSACTTHVPLISRDEVLSHDLVAAQEKTQPESKAKPSNDIRSDAVTVLSDAQAAPTNGGQSR